MTEMIRWKEDISHHSFRLACKRKHMGNAKESRERIRMGASFPNFSLVKFISSPTETKINGID